MIIPAQHASMIARTRSDNIMHDRCARARRVHARDVWGCGRGATIMRYGAAPAIAMRYACVDHACMDELARQKGQINESKPIEVRCMQLLG